MNTVVECPLLVGRGGCPVCQDLAAPAHHPVLRLGVFLPALPQTHMSQTHGTPRPMREQQPGSANQIRSVVFGGHPSARARDASALRPRLCQQPSGVRGRCSLTSYLGKQQQQLCHPAHAMLYPSCLLDSLTTINFIHVLSHVQLANNQISIFISRDLHFRKSRH